MRENNLLDFNMYESTLSQNLRQPDGAYAERPCSGGGASGGGGAGFTSVIVPFADFSQTSKFISRVYLRRSDTGIYDLSDIPTSNVIYVILLDPAKEITGLTNYQTYAIFTPHKDFVISTPFKGATVTAGDGKTYYVNYNGGSFEYVKIPSLPGGSGISNTFTVDIE